MRLGWLGLLMVICSLSTDAFSANYFQPQGRASWDMWFAKDADIYHMFFLEAPKYLGNQVHGNSMVGHATSKDLLHWHYEGPVLAPVNQSWNNQSIATGSVCKHGDQWYMLFSGWSSDENKSGLGLASSRDLSSWKKFEDGPVVKIKKVFESEYQGKNYKWIAHRDPYIYPDKMDGWYYAIACARIQNVPIETSGALAMIRSRDMLSWEPYKIISFPGFLEWMETPQLWRHGDKWYIYFGAVRNDDLLERNKEIIPKAFQYSRLSNCYFVSDRFDGPFEPLNDHEILLAAPLEPGEWSYIFKFLSDPYGQDVAITCINFEISSPYLVHYEKDGALRLRRYAKPSAK